MNVVYCDNCGCSIEDDREICTISLHRPYKQEENGIVNWYAEDRQYVLCPCCATGLIQVLDTNRSILSNLHGENCCDILPYGVRCTHKHTGRVPCNCYPGTSDAIPDQSCGCRG